MKISFYKRTVITREDGKPYMIRRTLFTCPWFSIKLHKILISDYDCLHDHPWAFLSLILWGGYVEHREVHKAGKNAVHAVPIVITRIYHPGTLLYRAAQSKHKLEIHQPCWTLVVTFKKTREWGFWTPNGWVPWRNYNYAQRC